RGLIEAGVLRRHTVGDVDRPRIAARGRRRTGARLHPLDEWPAVGAPGDRDRDSARRPVRRRPDPDDTTFARQRSEAAHVLEIESNLLPERKVAPPPEEHAVPVDVRRKDACQAFRIGRFEADPNPFLPPQARRVLEDRYCARMRRMAMYERSGVTAFR